MKNTGHRKPIVFLCQKIEEISEYREVKMQISDYRKPIPLL